ncbi:MAG: Eco57I restriction-modification methylase domain-containing protein [Brevinema sp.]
MEHSIGMTQEQIDKAFDEMDKAKIALEKADGIYTNSLEWWYEFPEVLDDEGHFIGFDLVIGNPPYFRYNTKHHSHISQINYFKNYDTYKLACVGKINAYEVFLMLSYRLCKDNGFICEIFQQSFLGDNASKGVRKFYLEHTNILKINSFPERDNTKKRVFEKVKMSVMTLLAQKGLNTQQIPMNIYSDRMKSLPKAITVDVNTLKTIDSDSMEIPNLNEEELIIFAKCYQNNKLISSLCKLFQGELNITNHKQYFTDDDTKTPFLVGANIQKYYVTNTPSQRTVPLYFDQDKYQQENKGKRSNHLSITRIAWQEVTGIDSRYRINACIIPKNVALAYTCGYLIPNKNVNFEFIIGLLNSWLLNWLFKARSTNAHTTVYEIARLPIPETTPEQQQAIIELVKQCMIAKTNDKNADISHLQKEIDKLVYALYGLSEDEIRIVEA